MFKLYEEYKDISDFSTEEIVHPSGGEWGSIHIDDRFIVSLEKIFSKEWMNEFSRKESHIPIELKKEFQHSKV